MLTGPYRQVSASSIGKSFCTSTGPLVIGQDPLGHLFFLVRGVLRFEVRLLCQKNLRLLELLILYTVDDDIPLQNLQQLIRNDRKYLRLASRFLQILAGFKQNLCPPSHLRRVLGQGFELGSQGASKKRNHKHHDKRDRIVVAVYI